MSDEPVKIGTIEEVSVQPNDIDRIVMKLEKALEGDRMDHAIIGLIALAIFLMNPKIEQGQLEQAIEDVTTYAAMAAADSDMAQSLAAMTPVVSEAN